MKKLYKVRCGKKLWGVCAGMAEYFDVKSYIIRAVFILTSFLAGAGVLGYIISAVVMPYEDEI